MGLLLQLVGTGRPALETPFYALLLLVDITADSLDTGRLAQLVITLVVPRSSVKYTSANILLGGAIESGASQASQQMGGYKTAYMTKTPPRAVFYGQVIGTYVGAVVAVFLYKVYTSVKTIPSEEFGIPDAHLYIVASRFIRRQGLPPRASTFTLVAFLLGATFSTLRIVAGKRRWRVFVPSGVALAIGRLEHFFKFFNLTMNRNT